MTTINQMQISRTLHIESLTPHELAEKREILKRYRHLLTSAAPRLKDGDVKLIKKAFLIAQEAHKDVRRKSGEPYIYHPLEVAQICVDEIGLGTTSIVCALLHDVVEDTETKLEDIAGQFGDKVAQIIDGLTKIKSVMGKGASEQAENFKKLLLTISEDMRVVLVKIADRLHNMRTLESMTKEKQLKIKSETQSIYAPLAHRLGLYTIKSELEDLCLKFSDQKAYDEIVYKIEQTKASRDKFIADFVKPIKESLDKQGFKYTIKSRTKSIYSIWNKMKKQGIPFEEVFDLFAIRVIADVPEEDEKPVCWRIYSTITDFYKPSIERLRDWISVPKSNGYESLHTTVMSNIGQWVEVQVRSSRMDDIAEKGLAAHWKYKGGKSAANIEQGIEMWIARVRETLETADTNALEFVDEFRSNLFNEEVYVFTPKGELKVLPHGATVLDFAFDIHTEVGAKCLGAKVNNVLVPLNHKVKNGDQVEILTSTKIKANEGWLKYLTTSKAKNKIKVYLKEDQKQQTADGKEIVLRKLKQLKIDYSNEILAQLTEFFACKTEPDFLIKLGKGQIDHTEIKKYFEYKEMQEEQDRTKVRAGDAKQFKEQFKQFKETGSDELVIGEDNDKVEYSLAPCCNPIPGDEIFGFTTVSRGIKIHRTSCPNAVDIMASFGNRIIKARWASDKTEAFEINLKVIGTDRKGIVNDVTRLLSNMLQINITAISFEGHNGVFEGNISLGVKDTKQVDDIIHKLNDIDGVVNVLRYDY
jgi:guanosine-3',5'-bis(diphosphate) 3'-pyrophosphohydrolase